MNVAAALPFPIPGSRGAKLCGVGLLALLAVAGLDLLRIRLAPEAALQSEREARLDRIEARHRALVDSLARALDAAAALPEAAGLESAGPAQRASAFQALSQLRRGDVDLAIRDQKLEPLAWAGPVTNAAALAPLSRRGTALAALRSGPTTRYVALKQVPSAGSALWASAEAVVSVQHQVRNDFLSDVEPLARSDGARLRFADGSLLVAGPGERALPSAEGHPVAVAMAPILDASVLLRRRALLWAGSLGLPLALLLLAFAASSRPRLGQRALCLLLARVAALPACAALAAVWSSPALSSQAYASAALGPLLASPLDLALTAATACGLAVLAYAASAGRPGSSSPTAATLSGGLAAVALLASLVGISDIVRSSTPALEAGGLLPTDLFSALLRHSCALLLVAGGLLAASAIALSRSGSPRRSIAVLGLALAGGLSAEAWAGEVPALSPLLALATIAVLVGRGAGRIAAAWAAASPEGRLVVPLLAAPLAGLLCQPLLEREAERALRQRIQADFAPRTRQLPEWRASVLSRTLEKVDSLHLLEGPGARATAHSSDQAFSAWATTDLAFLGLSSAVEIQDPDGLIVSRFALNLSTQTGPVAPLPRGTAWEQRSERLPIGSLERPVLHARRQVVVEAELRGALHVYLAEDFSNLPFLSPRGPYAALFRSASRAEAPEREVGLVVIDPARQTLYSSSERPPVPEPAMLSAAVARPSGSWSTLTLDGQRRPAWIFEIWAGAAALYYSPGSPSRSLGDAFEAAFGSSLLVAAALVLVILVRTALHRSTLTLRTVGMAIEARFSRRLFVALVALAIAPALVLQIVVRQVIEARLAHETENHALERASIAKKAVEDFAFFQRGDSPDGQPVTDSALVWVERLIRSDLDVFARGRLAASSKRELYASGLLASRVDGETYRRLVLEGQPSVLRTETIGAFSYSVVSVPVALGAGEPGILSLPLASRQREVDAVLSDLDRTARLASAGFLLIAAGLAFSMSRRISGPLRALTAATRRIAQGDLEARVAPATRDELRELVDAFNLMASDLARQRADLERSNRLAAWAEMARQVAHEVKNPLTPIQLATEHLRRVFKDQREDLGPTLEACTATILKQVASLREIVTEFSAFARPPEPESEPLDLNDVSRAAAEPYLAALPPAVWLEVVPWGEPLRVRGDRRLLSRAVVNLLENALAAVAESGRITLRSRLEGNRAVIDVEDDGPGVPPEVAGRAFEPYFSTRSGGTGLGLALVRRIAEAHEGGASLESAAGRGTCARLWLPSVQ